jgi:23S rRNA (guanine745-N1)-methyltransferase
LGLSSAETAIRCPGGHSFDLARQGYVSLLAAGSRTDTADGAAMVAARERFLGGGHYGPIAEAVADVCATADPGGDGCAVELGAGTGYYLAAVMERLPDRLGLALDVSKPALRRAARVHPRVAAIGCDVWGPLPLRDATVALALSVFAPRNPRELARALVPGGALVTVTPTPRHLGELVAALGLLSVDVEKPERLDRQLGEHFSEVAERVVEYELVLAHDDLAALVAMGPSAHHLDGDRIAAGISSLSDPLSVTVSVTIRTNRGDLHGSSNC